MEFTGLRQVEFCPNCELLVNYSGAAAPEISAERSAALRSAWDSIKGGRYNDADEGFKRAIDGAEDPRYAYAYGISLIRYSNYELSQISYTREGFMEENARHRDRSTELYAQAMMMMHRCIYMISRNSDYYKSPELRYCMILAMMKVENRRGARVELDGIGEIDRDGAISGYAEVAYGSYIRDYRNTLKLLDKRFDSGVFTHNDIYYLSFSLFKSGRIAASKRILELLIRLFKDERAGVLLEDVRRATAID